MTLRSTVTNHVRITAKEVHSIARGGCIAAEAPGKKVLVSFLTDEQRQEMHLVRVNNSLTVYHEGVDIHFLLDFDDVGAFIFSEETEITWTIARGDEINKVTIVKNKSHQLT